MEVDESLRKTLKGKAERRRRRSRFPAVIFVVAFHPAAHFHVLSLFLAPTCRGGSDALSSSAGTGDDNIFIF